MGNSPPGTAAPKVTSAASAQTEDARTYALVREYNNLKNFCTAAALKGPFGQGSFAGSSCNYSRMQEIKRILLNTVGATSARSTLAGFTNLRTSAEESAWAVINDTFTPASSTPSPVSLAPITRLGVPLSSPTGARDTSVPIINYQQPLNGSLITGFNTPLYTTVQQPTGGSLVTGFGQPSYGSSQYITKEPDPSFEKVRVKRTTRYGVREY